MGHAFDAFGSSVTIVQRGPRLLMTEDEAISDRFTHIAGDRFRLILDARVISVEPRGSGVAVTVSSGGGEPRVIEASA